MRNVTARPSTTCWQPAGDRRGARHLLAGYAEQAIPDFVRANDIDLLLMGAVARGTWTTR